MKVYVVLPAYNEEEALEPLISGLLSTFSRMQMNYSIVVVNDCSTDKTASLVLSKQKLDPNITLLNNEKNSGLAETLKKGLYYVLPLSEPEDIIITLDADNTQPPALCQRMIQQIFEGSDIVIASRYQIGSRVIGVPWDRQLLSFGARLLFTLIFPISGVRDYTCGFRAYRAEALKKVEKKKGAGFISERGFSCMPDILLKMRNENFVFTEVPLILRYDLKPGASKMKVIQTVLQTFALLFKRRLVSDK